MKCVFCDFEESKVVDTRSAEDGHAVRRRRECIQCGRRFTTFEKVETRPVMIKKKDGHLEPFDTEKLRAGLMKACEKRPAAQAQIDRVVAQIEKEILNLLEPEVPSRTVGELVMRALKELDEVAYVRFASVYRQFTDINTFMQELAALLQDQQKGN
ncbi:MAG: transcriptional regulator NrdR [Bacillota bacterium]